MAFDDLQTNRNAKLDNDMKELSDGTLCRLRSDQLRSAYLERAWRPRRRRAALLSDVYNDGATHAALIIAAVYSTVTVTERLPPS